MISSSTCTAETVFLNSKVTMQNVKETQNNPDCIYTTDLFFQVASN